MAVIYFLLAATRILLAEQKISPRRPTAGEGKGGKRPRKAKCPSAWEYPERTDVEVERRLRR
jgi:hypothetical protein